MWFTKFYNIRWSQKESFNKDLYTCGVFEHKFFPGVGGGNLNELIFKILNARGELPKGMLKFRIDRPITSWARTLLVVKKWFKLNREQWFFPFALNLKKKHSLHYLTWLLLRTIHSARVIRICCQNLERLFTSLTQQHYVLVLENPFSSILVTPFDVNTACLRRNYVCLNKLF